MTNSHGYVLEYPRIRVDHFDQAAVPLPASLLAHRRSIKHVPEGGPDAESLPFAPGQTHFDKPLLYLLTHIHTDHLKGLDRPGITAPIYCSAATKELLLKYERQKTRIEKDRDGTHTKNISVVRPYAHLRVTEDHATAKAKLSGFQSSSLDLLQPLPYNIPTKVQYTPMSTVTLTLIESNHMFGGTMFLIQGANGAVLHTGDMRAEPWWCEALTRNPYLSPYLCWSKPDDDSSLNAEADNWADRIESLGSTTSSSLQGDSQAESQSDASQQRHGNTGSMLGTSKSKDSRQSHLRLRNIYLDTELLLCNQKMPTKQQACLDMISLMRMYPPTTVFFLNCWTWGYEDMLIVTAKAFGCKIHVDRFKYIMYKAARIEAPFLADIVTQDGCKTRFHACEKRNVCSAVQKLASRYSSTADPVLAKEALAAHSQMDSSSPDARQRWGPFRTQPDPLLVYVNPGQIAADRWPIMFQDTKQRLEAAQRHETAWPEALVVPMERHSTLPELQMFVGLFRPKTVSPNTILDPKGGLDYYLLHHLFGHLLAGADDRRKLADEGLLMLGDKTWSFYEAQLAKARQQAQTKRGGSGAADSTEAVRAASASLNANASLGESFDAVQLERLSKLRGLSFKGLMMQNMAGNLAAMLEIERWRRAAGMDEPPEGLDDIIEDPSGEAQSKTDHSISSVDYDADHSQLAETQAFLTLHTRDEPAPVPAAPRPVIHETSHAGSCAASPPRPQSIGATQTKDTQSSVPEDEELPTALTEDLASRYLNVIIHHFGVSFHRTNGSYVQMWESVRRKLPEDAQKVEEHWFRETGVLPPLWSERGEPSERQHIEPHRVSSPNVKQQPVPKAKRDTHEHAKHTSEPTSTAEGSTVFGDIFTSFVDMLATNPSSPDPNLDLLPVSTLKDRTVALQLIFHYFAKVGFHSRLLVDSIDTHGEGQSHASCLADLPSAEWGLLAVPLNDLSTHLATELRTARTFITDPHSSAENLETMVLSLQLTGVLLSHRPLNAVIEPSGVQRLLEGLILIVEAAPSDSTTLSKAAKKVVGLACAVLKAEEVEEAVLGPFEGRLLALVQRPDGLLGRRLESLVESSDAGVSSQSMPPQQVGQVYTLAPREVMADGAVQRDDDEISGDENARLQEEVSSMIVRPPRIAAAPIQAQAQHVSPDRPDPEPTSYAAIQQDQPQTTETDSVIATQTAAEDDTIESINLTSHLAQASQASQASSATQEEDSTQSEQEEESSQLGSLPAVRPLPAVEAVVKRGRTAIVRTGSLPSLLKDGKGVSGGERVKLTKRRLGADFGEGEKRSARRSRR
ncbi:uncharacterized protein UTRI_00691_B [Ustilago trichophora]|uniref:DNA repair metallo-beta-lactamase domain-containing protein n=1 Tax=Ustilago trichophora TaxID=86804 RepID=A0A5C3DQB3_9BASI|nr:uncharacterized protein UTRI_00691_B [Ustilago trichophora]